MPVDQRARAEKLLKQLERVREIIWDPETSTEKRAEVGPIVAKYHALHFRGRTPTRHTSSR
jgi:hypothetical protein